jgi:hypothetical protein
MAKGKGGASTPAAKDSTGEGRNNGKTIKKNPKVFDAVKRRLVIKK